MFVSGLRRWHCTASSSPSLILIEGLPDVDEEELGVGKGLFRLLPGVSLLGDQPGEGVGVAGGDVELVQG